MTLDRLYTAFVSSTFVDLQHERQTVQQVLLGQSCVPLGMEFFPSTGVDQWSLIEESMDSADFCLFIVAGRYGSRVAANGISWTHREFQSARRSGKPIIVLMHGAPERLPAGECEATDDGRESLRAFREEISTDVHCCFYTNETELVMGLVNSIARIRQDKLIEGWVRAGPRPVLLQEDDFEYRFDIIDIDWSFARSADGDTWDAQYECTRRIQAHDPGIPGLMLDFTRDTEDMLPFVDGMGPRLELLPGWERSSLTGGLYLNPPRRTTGASFVQDVIYRPPLSSGEHVTFTIKGELPAYKFAYADDMLRTTVNTRFGARTFDWSSRNIMFPTDLLRIRVFIPSNLGAKPIGPMAGRAGTIDQELSAELRNSSFRQEDNERSGEPGIQMTLEVDQPRLRRWYRLAWNLPSRTTDSD